MDYRIVLDSGCDLDDSLREDPRVISVPLQIEIEGKHYVDDRNISIESLLVDMKESKNPPRTSCPSPHEYQQAFGDAENVFVVTLSSQLSGSYNSAVVARDLALEHDRDRFIHVFDSLSASAGETVIALKLRELVEQKLDGAAIVSQVDRFIDGMKTFCILESVDNLAKNGRLSKIAAKLISLLFIKPILGADGEGHLKLFDKARGANKAFERLEEMIGEQGQRFEEKILAISHCNAYARAEDFMRRIRSRYGFKDVVITKTAGLSTVYADNGGVVVAF